MVIFGFVFFSWEATIGPPAVSLVGCGNCLHVSISLPVADSSSNVDNIYTLFDPSFRVVYKKSGGKVGNRRRCLLLS